MTRVPPPELQTAVRELVARDGMPRVAKALSVANATVARLAGGLPVNDATIVAAEVRLRGMAVQPPTEEQLDTWTEVLP